MRGPLRENVFPLQGKLLLLAFPLGAQLVGNAFRVFAHYPVVAVHVRLLQGTRHLLHQGLTLRDEPYYHSTRLSIFCVPVGEAHCTSLEAYSSAPFAVARDYLLILKGL